jgi:hypothetical protein
MQGRVTSAINLRTMERRVASFMLQPIYPKKTSLCYPFDKRLGRPDMPLGREVGEESNYCSLRK